MSLEWHLLAVAPSRSILLASCLPWHPPHSSITVLFCPAVGSGTQIPVTNNWSLWNCALKEAVLFVFVLLGCLTNTKKSNTERNEQLVEVIRGLGWGVFVFLQIHCKTWENKGEVSRTQSMTGRLHGHHAPLRLSHPCGASATSGSVPIKESPWFWVPIKVFLPESWSGRNTAFRGDPSMVSHFSHLPSLVSLVSYSDNDINNYSSHQEVSSVSTSRSIFFTIFISTQISRDCLFSSLPRLVWKNLPVAFHSLVVSFYFSGAVIYQDLGFFRFRQLFLQTFGSAVAFPLQCSHHPAPRVQCSICLFYVCTFCVFPVHYLDIQMTTCNPSDYHLHKYTMKTTQPAKASCFFVTAFLAL